MRESIANSFVVNIVIIFVIIIMLFLVGSLSYSKAFKVKNRIINAIETDKGFTSSTVLSIEEGLEEIGYRIDGSNGKECKQLENTNCQRLENMNVNHRYCIYQCNTSRGHYYKVTAFMYFDIPIIGETLEIPITGETRTFYEDF